MASIFMPVDDKEGRRFTTVHAPVVKYFRNASWSGTAQRTADGHWCHANPNYFYILTSTPCNPPSGDAIVDSAIQQTLELWHFVNNGPQAVRGIKKERVVFTIAASDMIPQDWVDYRPCGKIAADASNNTVHLPLPTTTEEHDVFPIFEYILAMYPADAFISHPASSKPFRLLEISRLPDVNAIRNAQGDRFVYLLDAFGQETNTEE